MRNVHRREIAGKEIDGRDGQDFSQERIFSRNISLWINGMKNEAKSVHIRCLPGEHSNLQRPDIGIVEPRVQLCPAGPLVVVALLIGNILDNHVSLW